MFNATCWAKMPRTIFNATCWQKSRVLYSTPHVDENAADYIQRHVLVKCRVLYSTPRVCETGQSSAAATAARRRPRAAAREPLIVGVIVQHYIVVAVIGGRCRRPGRHFVARLRTGDVGGGASWDGGAGHHRSYQLLSHGWSHLNVGPEKDKNTVTIVGTFLYIACECCHSFAIVDPLARWSHRR
jgi:hypothetical protein